MQGVGPCPQVFQRVLGMVNLVEQGGADQKDVARTFLRSARTVRRCQARFAGGGLAALGQCRGYPKGRRRS